MKIVPNAEELLREANQLREVTDCAKTKGQLNALISTLNRFISFMKQRK